MADYQPAIALAAFLVLAHCVLVVLRAEDGRCQDTKAFPIERIAAATGTLVLAAVVYYITLKMTTGLVLGRRTHINNPSEVIQQLQGAYPALISYFTSGSDYLPFSLRWLPLAVVMVGASSLVVAAWRNGY
ncbi:MAG: hypothetical protein P8013_05875 [Candidatus Sulfobium sp.]|jgi:hypothetical protein